MCLYPISVTRHRLLRDNSIQIVRFQAALRIFALSDCGVLEGSGADV
jgi:hypothetical protein